MILDLAVDLHRFDNEDLDMIQNHMIQKHDAEIWSWSFSYYCIIWRSTGKMQSNFESQKKDE